MEFDKLLVIYYAQNKAQIFVIQKRRGICRLLHNQGLKTWVSMEPYPTPNLSKQDLSEILEKISFVDKIIFGKLNYNVRVSDSRDNNDFYNNCANAVIDFCEKNKIEHHIKYGTKKTNDRKTERIFRNFSSATFAVDKMLKYDIMAA